jgi:hypothetical protein
MPDAVRIAAIRHGFGEPQANTMLALRLPQKQQATIGGLVAAGKIDVSFCVGQMAGRTEAAYRQSYRLWHRVDTRGNSWEHQFVM